MIAYIKYSRSFSSLISWATDGLSIEVMLMMFFDCLMESKFHYVHEAANVMMQVFFSSAANVEIYCLNICNILI